MEQLFPPWRNYTRPLKYPFADRCNLTATNGVILAADLFDDARIYPVGGEAGMYIGRITLDGTTVTLEVYGPTKGSLATSTYDSLSGPEVLSFVDSNGNPAGLMVSDTDRLQTLAASLPFGNTLFLQDATEFISSVAVPIPDAGVIAVEVNTERLSGDVYLVGVDGVVLSVEDGYIRVDAIGNPYALIKLCEQQSIPVSPICGLKTINDIPPNGVGDFKITVGANVAVDNILRILQDSGIFNIQTSVSGQGCHG
jgi:hypothetical protein